MGKAKCVLSVLGSRTQLLVSDKVSYISLLLNAQKLPLSNMKLQRLITDLKETLFVNNLNTCWFQKILKILLALAKLIAKQR